MTCVAVSLSVCLCVFILVSTYERMHVYFARMPCRYIHARVDGDPVLHVLAGSSVAAKYPVCLCNNCNAAPPGELGGDGSVFGL